MHQKRIGNNKLPGFCADYRLNEFKIIPVKTVPEIRNILSVFDSEFNPPLSNRVHNLDAYAEKLCNHAVVYAAEENIILGFMAFYSNNRETNIAYLTLIAIKQAIRKKGVGRALLDECMKISKANGMSALKLDVRTDNYVAIRFYEINGFKFFGKASEDSMHMIKYL